MKVITVPTFEEGGIVTIVLDHIVSIEEKDYGCILHVRGNQYSVDMPRKEVLILMGVNNNG